MSKTIKIHIIKAGLQTLVQDGGRKGHEAFGVPVSGAMDLKAYQLANQLVGNMDGSPVLEITLLGPKLEFQEATQIAITGADLSPKVNDAEIPLAQLVTIPAGGILSFGKIKKGCRAYIAINGIWKIKKWLGSYSAFPFDDGDATPDSFIKKGNFITIDKHFHFSIQKKERAHSPITNSPVSIRVMAGPEFERFPRTTIANFFSQKYSISAESNRMGYKLEQQLADFQAVKGIISSGVIPGTVQITNAGQPIILMKDAQTTGGYARIANVIAEDLDVLAQLKPGDEMQFLYVNSNIEY